MNMSPCFPQKTRQTLASLLLIGLTLAPLAACAGAGKETAAVTMVATSQDVPMRSEDIIALADTVAAWQIEQNKDLSYLPDRIPQSSYNRGWVKGTFFIGVDRFAAVTDNKELQRYLLQQSLENGFELGERSWHGDDQIMGYVYANLALRKSDAMIVRPTQEVFDGILADPPQGSLEFVEGRLPGAEGDCQLRWCWADAIFMAPPAWAKVSTVTGDPRYADYAATETKAVIEYLFDRDTGLIFRDSRYINQRTENGKKVFWSRGNGWVFAGLARLIDALPTDHPDRAYFVSTFQTMADTLVNLQRADGYWPTSLMDPDMFKNPETSGSAFFTFGLSWGVNNGLLKGERYVTARDKGWAALVAAVGDDGHFGWVQQIGKDPQATSSDSTQLYGTGGFLLAASEMIRAAELATASR
jgi:rhamnogalacturonyl hydrolase YesR